MMDSLVSRTSPRVMSDGGAVYTRYIIGPSLRAWVTRIGLLPLLFSSSMRRTRFRSPSAANSLCASAASVDGHIVVHPWRSPGPVRFDFHYSTAPRYPLAVPAARAEV